MKIILTAKFESLKNKVRLNKNYNYFTISSKIKLTEYIILSDINVFKGIFQGFLYFIMKLNHFYLKKIPNRD